MEKLIACREFPAQAYNIGNRNRISYPTQRITRRDIAIACCFFQMRAELFKVAGITRSQKETCFA